MPPLQPARETTIFLNPTSVSKEHFPKDWSVHTFISSEFPLGQVPPPLCDVSCGCSLPFPAHPGQVHDPAGAPSTRPPGSERRSQSRPFLSLRFLPARGGKLVAGLNVALRAQGAGGARCCALQVQGAQAGEGPGAGAECQGRGSGQGAGALGA